MATRPVHFEFYSTAPTDTVKFFEQAFGWSIKRWDDNNYWIAFTGPDGPGIDGGITEAPEGEHPFTMNTLQVDNMQEAVAAVEEAGGETVSEIWDIPNVGCWIKVREPGGNVFGMMEPYESDQDAPPSEE